MAANLSPKATIEGVDESPPRKSMKDNRPGSVKAPSLRSLDEDDTEPLSPNPAPDFIAMEKKDQPKKKSPRRTSSLKLWVQKAGQSSREGQSPSVSPQGKRGDCMMACGHRSADGLMSSVEWAEVDFTSPNGSEGNGIVVKRRGAEVAGEDRVKGPRSEESNESTEDIMKKLRKAGITSKQMNKLKANGLKIMEE